MTTLPLLRLAARLQASVASSYAAKLLVRLPRSRS